MNSFFKNIFKPGIGKIKGHQISDSRERMTSFIEKFETTHPFALNLKKQVRFMTYKRLSYWYGNIVNLR